MWLCHLRAGGDIRPCHGHRAHLRSELVTCPASPAGAIPSSSSASVSGLVPPGGRRQGGPICFSPASSLSFTLLSLWEARQGHQHTHSPQPSAPAAEGMAGSVRAGRELQRGETSPSAAPSIGEDGGGHGEHIRNATAPRGLSQQRWAGSVVVTGTGTHSRSPCKERSPSAPRSRSCVTPAGPSRTPWRVSSRLGQGCVGRAHLSVLGTVLPPLQAAG